MCGHSQVNVPGYHVSSLHTPASARSIWVLTLSERKVIDPSFLVRPTGPFFLITCLVYNLGWKIKFIKNFVTLYTHALKKITVKLSFLRVDKEKFQKSRERHSWNKQLCFVKETSSQDSEPRTSIRAPPARASGPAAQTAAKSARGEHQPSQTWGYFSERLNKSTS